MRRYLFHIYNNIETLDDEGKELGDLSAARAHAIKGARDLMCADIMQRGEINLSHWIEVEDENAEVTVVPFGQAVKVRP